MKWSIVRLLLRRWVKSLARDATHISGLTWVLTHQVTFLIILVLITLEVGPDSLSHQCQAQRRQREGNVHILWQRKEGRHIGNDPCRQRLMMDLEAA